MKRVLTLRQQDAFRRILLVVAHELTTAAKSNLHPDNWGDIGLCSYAKKAQDAVYREMAEDGILPQTDPPVKYDADYWTSRPSILKRQGE